MQNKLSQTMIEIVISKSLQNKLSHIMADIFEYKGRLESNAHDFFQLITKIET